VKDHSLAQQIIKNFTSCPNITDVSSLGNGLELGLKECQGITELSSLGSVPDLNLRSSRNFCDVSALEIKFFKILKFRRLNLNSCLQITDVSALRMLALHLRYFSGSDVSGLTNVKKLILNSAPFISNISMLKNVKELHVQYCLVLRQFQGLDNIRYLSTGKYIKESLDCLQDRKRVIRAFNWFRCIGMI
jgi:hypothetical protein